MCEGETRTWVDTPNQRDEKEGCSKQLDKAGAEHRVAHLPQALEAQLKPDEEQEHRDAKLRDVAQRFCIYRRVAEEFANAIRPDNRSCQEIAENGA